MSSVLQLKNSTIQTSLNMTSQFNMTSQLNDSRENIQIEMPVADWTNNRPLFILIGCLFIIMFFATFSWYINIYLPEKELTSCELLLDDEFNFENKNNSRRKKCKLPTLV